MPSGLTGTATGSTSISLSWTASTDNVGVTGYRVERCQGTSCTDFGHFATPTGTTFSNTGLAAGTTYRYRVRAFDAAGNLSAYSPDRHGDDGARRPVATPQSGWRTANLSLRNQRQRCALDAHAGNCLAR